jgi:eukaryotic-like serine/threonine-protein kinase
VDEEVEELLRQERVLDAARLTCDRGDARRASLLFERACDWQSAAREAFRAGDAVRALELAVRADDDALAEAAAAAIAANAAEAPAVAERLSQLGQHAWAALVLERTGRTEEAAHAWERAGEPTRSAGMFEHAGDPGRAARTLEAALRRDPGATDAALALGALLVRFGKDEAAVRFLQRVPPGATERREALKHMVRALERLGLATAANEASGELSALGGAAEVNEPPREEIGAVLYGRYDVVRQVASSARARIVEGVDRATGGRVALKLFAAGDRLAHFEEGLARFEQDLGALRALDHPAIVPIRVFYRQGPALVLEWMDGGTVEQAILRGSIAPARAVEIACSVLRALSAAHRLGVLHRDVRASNVLFDSTGAARLKGFAETRIADASTTVTAGDFGALGATSPEQRAGREATVRSDIFSVGALLCEMLAGEMVVSAARRPRPSEAHSGLDARHDDIVALLTAEEAEGRPDDALEARDRLLSVPWPVFRAEPKRRAMSAPTGRPIEARVERRPDGSLVDLWTARGIERVPLTEAALARARAFAKADHRALQAVLRVDREAGFVWLAKAGRPLDRPLTLVERARVGSALEAVQAAGGTDLDLHSVGVALDGSEVVVCFSSAQRSSTTE